MKRHLCILFCFRNTEHIKKCFNCLQTGFTDFFIVENHSENSEGIKQFFISNKDNIVGYYQFKENITNNALTIMLSKNKQLLEQYEYVTLSDCDLYVEDSISTFEEIFKNLYFKDVIFSAVDLSDKDRPPKDVWRTSNKPPTEVNDDYIEAFTGAWLLTVLNKNIDRWYPTSNFLDSSFHKKVKKEGKKWVKTLVNKADHLTWELCYEGSDYIDLKNNLGRKAMWGHHRRCEYTEVI